MVLEANVQSPPSLIARLALLVDQKWGTSGPNHESLTAEFVGVVKAVAQEEQPITIRIARLLAWAKTQDAQQAGYPGWPAFAREHSPWRESRTREYVRLVESALDLIKEALSNNEIGLTLATRAPKDLGDEASREAQLQWLLEAKLGALPERCPALMEMLSGDEMRRVLKARRLGAILVGGDAPIPVVDDFLVQCHEQKLTGDQILDGARTTPPKPDRLERAVPDWRRDPAESLVGPWVEPTDLRDAVAKLRALELLLAKRRVLLGMAYLLVKVHFLWTYVPGCNSLAQFCGAYVGITQRTFQRYAQEGLDHFQNPQVREEIEEGRITYDRATFALDRAGGSKADLQTWIDLAKRLGRTELRHVQDLDLDLRKECAPAMDMARVVESIVRGEIDPEASAVGGPAAEIAEHLRSVGATGPIQIALRDDTHRRSRSREPLYIFAPPKLLAAADYVLSVVVLPAVHGPRRMVEHDLYTCQNPRCRRTTLRVHPHHMHQQQHGGTDDPANIVTGCPACHLRGIHSGRMSVVRIGDWLVWTWPDGGAVIMDSPVSDLVYERRVREAAPSESEQPGVIPR